METLDHAAELLCRVMPEHGPQDRGGGRIALEKLKLFVEIREVQSMASDFMALFISEIITSTREGEDGMRITCVGMAENMETAVGDAVGQWGFGVLPVLAQWRGGHSCTAESRRMESKSGPFDLVAGPILARGGPDDASQPPEHVSNLLETLLDRVSSRRLAQKVHWLEMYACKSDDGQVDATCRLDNRDWSLGQQVLEGIAGGWPDADEPLRSCRQFAMLLPSAGDREEIVVPSFWARLLGRA